jgi:hypothetical protein
MCRFETGLIISTRFPIWIWPQVITMFMVLGATLSTDYATFTTFRSLQGLFGTVPQVIGLPIIYDIYRPDGKISCHARRK